MNPPENPRVTNAFQPYLDCRLGEIGAIFSFLRGVGQLVALEVPGLTVRGRRSQLHEVAISCLAGFSIVAANGSATRPLVCRSQQNLPTAADSTALLPRIEFGKRRNSE